MSDQKTPAEVDIAAQRARTLAARTKVEAGEYMTWEEIEPMLLPLDSAIHVAFSDPPDDCGDEGLYPRCCGARCSTSGGVFGGRSKCLTCGATIVDVLAPLHSPLLPSGSGHVSVPGDALIADCERAGGSWLVMHEGSR